MKLTYRSVGYESSLSGIATVEGAFGQYRGIASRFRVRKEVFIPYAIVCLKYRGADYIGLR